MTKYQASTTIQVGGPGPIFRKSGRSVLITGAGFSAGFGYPLTNQILDRIKLKLAVAPNKKWTMGESFERFITRLPEPPPDFEELMTLIKSHIEPYDKTWLALLGISAEGLYNEGDPVFHYEMMIEWLGRALEVNQWTGDEPKHRDTNSLILQQIKSRYALKALGGQFGPFGGLITTNYDLLPEELIGVAAGIDYGFPEGAAEYVTKLELRNEGKFNQHMKVTSEPRPLPSHAFPLFKIHGNENSTFCRGCGKVLIYEESRSQEEDAIHSFFAWPQTTGYRFSFHCTDLEEGKPAGISTTSVKPLILPPLTKKKSLREWELLQPVVQSAQALAAACDLAVVVGTAVRESDEELRETLRQLDSKKIIFVGGKDGVTNLAELVPKADIQYCAELLEDFESCPGTPH